MKKLIFFVVVSLVLFLAGCSEKSTSPKIDTESTYSEYYLDFDLQSLADSALVLEEEPLYNPPVQNSDPTLLPVGQYDRYCVEIIWGCLDNTSHVQPEEMNWSGALLAGFEGAIFPASLIDFEEGQDSLLMVNTVNMVPWVSKTNGDFDGIVFDVYYCTNVSYFAAPQLYFKTLAYEHSWYVEELDGLEEVYQVDNDHQVSIKAKKVSDGDCPEGRLAGKWIHKDRNTGFFYGKWMTEFCSVTGYLFGKFWTEDNGDRLFKGYWLGLSRCLQGYFDGKWEYSEDPAVSVASYCYPKGYFKGRFTDRNSNYIGHLEGKFGLPLNADISPQQGCYQPSAFIGTWWVDCPDVVLK